LGVELIHEDGRTDRQTDRHDEFCERVLQYSDVGERWGLYGANINWLLS